MTVVRQPPFLLNRTGVALGHLRGHWEPSHNVRLRVGVAVYHALLEVAARELALVPGIESFETTRFEIAKLADISDRSVDHAVAELERIGLLRVERRKHGTAFLPSLYTILEPPVAQRAEAA